MKRSNLTKITILIIISLLWTASSSLAIASEPKKIPAFPGAEGGGAWSLGGRGGRVIEVTNLKDSGSGSLRAALEASGPRIVVFRVGGTIELKELIIIRNPYLTIAGQTAPGDGITLKDNGIRIMTHNVIVRYMRFRPGDDSKAEGIDVDGINITNRPDDKNDKDAMVHDIILDHVSVSWAIDKNIGVWNSRPEINEIENITIQWSIISEGLANNRHYEGEHSKGVLIGEYSNNVSMHHNLFAHNTARNPKVKGGSAEVINNVVYNSADAGVTVAGSGDSSDPAQILNYIGNYEIKGADSKNVKNLVIFTPEGKDNDKKGHKIYVEGNIGGRRSSLSEDEWLVVSDKWGDDLDGIPNAWKLSKPFSIDGIPVTTQDYETAYDMVLEEAGANIVRDAVDARIVKEVKNRTGRIIDRPEDVGGFPKLSGGNAPKDSDRDGMPDSWEQQQGLNPNNPADGSGDLDGDGYTNVEEYLNRADKSSQSLPPTPTMSFQLSFPVMMNGYTGNTSGSGSDNSGSDNSGSDNSGSDNTPITLVSIDDTYTRDGSYETDNYGSNDVMQIRNRSVDGEDKKAYIKFDISSIDNISSATLRLYGRVRRDTNTLVIYSVGSNSWDEMEVTANNAPDFDREVATLSLDNNEDQWLEIDLTEHVKSHKEKGRPKLSLMLYSSEDGESVMYVKSKEHDNAPELIIR